MLPSRQGQIWSADTGRAAPPLLQSLSVFHEASSCGQDDGHCRDHTTFRMRPAALLRMILPLLGLGLASIGLCGMTVYNASHSDGGIRMDRGATAAQMLWLVMAMDSGSLASASRSG